MRALSRTRTHAHTPQGDKQMTMLWQDEVNMTETNKTNPSHLQNTLSHYFSHLGFKAGATTKALAWSADAKPGLHHSQSIISTEIVELCEVKEVVAK